MIVAEYWAWYYDDKRNAGKGEEEFEDDEDQFAADIAEMAAEAEAEAAAAAATEDDWEDVEPDDEGET